MSQLDFLFARFAEGGTRPFMIWRGEPHSYEWLLRSVARWHDVFAGAGVGAGHVVTLEGDYSPEGAALLLATFQRRAVAVPLCLPVETRRELFRAIAGADYVVRLQRDRDPTIERTEGGRRHELVARLAQEGHAGLLVFTSGTTGESKAVLHDVTRLLSKFAKRKQPYVMLAFLMFDHIGGINTLFTALASLGTLVVSESRDPEVICQTIARHGVQLLPATPTFMNLLLASEAHRRHDLSSVKRITYGTEPMPAMVLERVIGAFPGVAVQQMYGTSELGILGSKSQRDDSTWIRLGGEGNEIKVHNGTLWVRARTAMIGYLDHPSPFDADGWYDTGDEVEVDGDFIRIRGRRSEIINVGGEKIHPAEIENVLLQMPNVVEATVCGESNAIMGRIVTARVLLRSAEDPVDFRNRARAHCLKSLRPAHVPARITIADSSAANERMKLVRKVD